VSSLYRPKKPNITYPFGEQKTGQHGVDANFGALGFGKALHKVEGYIVWSALSTIWSDVTYWPL
jgi:hypothetical protein